MGDPQNLTTMRTADHGTASAAQEFGGNQVPGGRDFREASVQEKRMAGYFFWSARVRMSLAALVRRVSGTFLLRESFFRSTGFSSGSMWRVTSRGVLALFMRLRTTT